MKTILDGWQAEGVRYVRFELPDIHGGARSKIVPISAAYGYAETGLNMYGGAAVLDSRSDVVGGSRYNEEVGYGDQYLHPDPDTACRIPWLPDTARVICESTWADGTPLAANPRTVLRRILDRCTEHGWDVVSGSEPEFYLLDPTTRQPYFGGYHIFNSTRNVIVPVVGELLDLMPQMGIDLITANCEYGPSQFEINFGPGRGIAGADKVHTFKNAVKEVAALRGALATFMSKPFSGYAGCGSHFHVSVLDPSGDNLMADESDAHGISEFCRWFIGGNLRYAAEIYCLLVPTLNCLKRRRTHTFSPTNISWGFEDRSALIRVKAGGSVQSRHVEQRAPSGLSNPYLVAAAVLAAGMLGVEGKIDPGPPSPPGRPAEEEPDFEQLPESLWDSLARLDGSAEMRSLLGDEFVDVYLTVRRYELQRFSDSVTDWERDEYMELY
ncbi:MAG: glutamine synthetase family protein [Gaiellales bacterium]